MPDYTSWPQTADVQAWLAQTDLSLPSTDLIQAQLDTAQAEVAELTRYSPFLVPSGATATARYYNQTGNNGFLNLGNGLLTLTSVLVGTTTQTLNTNFQYGSSVAPYTWLRFAAPVCESTYPTITVTGVWGYSTTVPPRIWTAVVQRAAALCGESMAGLTELKSGQDGGTASQWVSAADRIEKWTQNFYAVCRFYRNRSL